MIKIEIDDILPSLNLWYAGIHWSKRKKLVDLWHTMVKIYVNNNKVKPVEKYPVCIISQTFLKSKRSRDTDNGILANKICCDGLVLVGILKDDTPEYVIEHRVLRPIFEAKENKTIIVNTKLLI